MTDIAVPEQFSRYNTADYLTDHESTLAYFEAAMEHADDDPALAAVAFENIARARRKSQPA